MSGFSLALRQVRYENKAFWRNPTAAFFTFVLPLIFLVILNALLGDEETTIDGQEAALSEFYVPSMVTLSIVNACYTTIVMMVSIAREEGLLKRVKGTPLPGWAFLFGRIAHATLIALLLVAIIIAFGAVFYGVEVPGKTMSALFVTALLGAATFSALGLAVSSFVPNAQAASAIANATVLPILFISGIFVKLGEDAPAWIDYVGDFFPVKHLLEACLTAFSGGDAGWGFEWWDLAVMAVWGVVGAAVAVRYFSWEPRE